MSCDYQPEQNIPFEEMLQRVVEETNIKIIHTPESTRRNAVILFDGKNYIWAFRTRDNNTQFTRFGDNDEEYIIITLQNLFATHIASEHETGTWREELTG